MRTAAFLLAMLTTAALPLHAEPPGAPAGAGGATVRSRIDNSTVPAGADGILMAAISRETVRLAAERRDLNGSARRAFGGQATAGGHRSWIGRHPVWFGAIVGAVGGAVIVGATVHPEASFIGFFGGGAAGALVGFVTTR